MAQFPDAAGAAKLNCGLYLVAQNVSGFDPNGFSIAFWARWRDPTFMDPCFIDNPGEQPTFTTSRDTAWLFSYNDYPDGTQEGARLTLSAPSSLKLWNSGNSLAFGFGVDDGQWHFVAFSMAPADRKHDRVIVWLDGQQKLDALLYHDEGFPTPNGKQLGIACEYANGSQDNLFVGGLSQFQIWAGSLDTDKIAALMQTPPVPAHEPNLRVLVPLTQHDMEANDVHDIVGGHCGPISVYST
jgi:hypothetical protein